MEETKELLLTALEQLSTEVEARMNGFATRLSELEKVCAGLLSELKSIKES